MGHTGSGLTPVTFGAFAHPTGQNNSNLAANNVSWYDAVVFMNRLSVLSGLTPVFQLNGDAANLLNVNPPISNNTAWNNITMDASGETTFDGVQRSQLGVKMFFDILVYT